MAGTQLRGPIDSVGSESISSAVGCDGRISSSAPARAIPAFICIHPGLLPIAHITLHVSCPGGCSGCAAAAAAWPRSESPAIAPAADPSPGACHARGKGGEISAIRGEGRELARSPRLGRAATCLESATRDGAPAERGGLGWAGARTWAACPPAVLASASLHSRLGLVKISLDLSRSLNWLSVSTLPFSHAALFLLCRMGQAVWCFSITPRMNNHHLILRQIKSR